MLSGTFENLLSAVAGCAATLTGLLFVAMTVADRQSRADRPVVIGQVRATASIVAFTNALAVSLYGLVPGNNIGYPAIVLAGVGIFYTAAGTRSIFSSHAPQRQVLRQLQLIALLLAVFAAELAGGIDLVLNPRGTGADEFVCDLLVALLMIGIARAWELVGDRGTGPLASIALLTGHDRDSDDSSNMRAPRAAPPSTDSPVDQDDALSGHTSGTS